MSDIPNWAAELIAKATTLIEVMTELCHTVDFAAKCCAEGNDTFSEPDPKRIRQEQAPVTYLGGQVISGRKELIDKWLAMGGVPNDGRSSSSHTVDYEMKSED